MEADPVSHHCAHKRHRKPSGCREFHRYAALPKIGLHQLPARTIALHETSRVEYGFFQARPHQRRLESCDMEVDIGVVRLKGFINAARCIFYGLFTHVCTPVVVYLAAITFPIRPYCAENGSRQLLKMD